MSEIDTTGTGVRIEIPSNLSFNWGRALVTAIAAPVEDGTRLTAAARPIRKSLLEGASIKD